MRTMKAILITAGEEKRTQEKEDESLLLVQCIKNCITPRLIEADLPLFNNIITYVSPDVNAETKISENFEKYLKEAFSANGGSPQQTFLKKCSDVFDTTLVIHGLMLVGGTMSGKSLCWKSPKDSLNKLHENGEGKSIITIS